MLPIRFKRATPWNALPADSYCCGVGGARCVAFLAGALSRSVAGALRLLRGLLHLLSRSGLASRRRHGRASGPISAPPASGIRGRLVVRLRLFRRRAVVGGRRHAGRGRQLRLGAADRGRLPAGHPGGLLRSGRSTGAAVWSDDIGRIAALAASFALLEWLRTFLFTGFPWNPIGYAAMPTPLLMQSVSVVGMVGMNALAVFVFSMPALLAGYRNVRVGLALALLLAAAHVGFGYFRLGPPTSQPVRSLPVRIVQPAIDQAAEARPHFARRDFPDRCSTFRPRRSPPIGAKPKLIIWPETSLPFLFTDRPDALVAIGELLADGQILLAGNVRAEGQGRTPTATTIRSSR